MGQGSGAQGTNRGFNQLKKRARSSARNPTLTGFLEERRILMCGLTTEWILESAQSLACALIRRTFYALSGELLIPRSGEGTQTLRRELARS